MPLLLVVDDDPDLLVLLSAHYGVRGYVVAVAETCEAALRLAAERRPDAVLLDFCLPKMDGARFIEILRADVLTKKTPVIVMSAASASWVATRLPRDPLIRTLEKPFEFNALDPLLDELIGA
ncbi:MAG TPA: response regulator [Elusimicrobiota bacterium]|jgi:CheY-like chemotaxis protein|nr:response regulator [Elusimicrobiota bacterium]